MEDKRDSFVFYRSFRDALDYLDDDADFRELVTMMMDRALDRKAVHSENKLITTFYRMIEPNIDANYRKAVNGKKGGRPPKNQDEEGGEPEDKAGGKPKVKTGKKPKVNEKETSGFQENNQWLKNNKPDVDVNEDVDGNEEISPTKERSCFIDELGDRYDTDTGEMITPFDYVKGGSDV